MLCLGRRKLWCQGGCQCVAPLPASSLLALPLLELNLMHGGAAAVTCILQWATSRPDATCPTCKTPFTCLLVHRDVDGSLCDSPISETVSFLARAPWYVNWAREQSQIHELTRQHAVFRSVEAAESERSPLALAQEEWAEEAMYTYFEEEYDDDGMDDFVVTGGSRTTFGNRRWGEGGYVSSGRRRAQPVQPRRGKGSVKGRAQGGAGSGGHKGGPAQSSAGTKQEQQQGRRAQRKAKRAAADRGF